MKQNMLLLLSNKCLNSSINLGPKPERAAAGNEKFPWVDNHSMGTVFAELVRRFNEENNEEAGEHFIPRDVLKLQADLICLPIVNQSESDTYLVYDGAGGLRTVAEDAGKEVSSQLYGQEVQAATYAIAKADLLLKGEGAAEENIKTIAEPSPDYIKLL